LNVTNKTEDATRTSITHHNSQEHIKAKLFFHLIWTSHMPGFKMTKLCLTSKHVYDETRGGLHEGLLH